MPKYIILLISLVSFLFSTGFKASDLPIKNVKQTKYISKKEPKNNDFVLVSDYIEDIAVDLKYATDDNFTKKVIYDFDLAYLRYGTVKKLLKVQKKLKKKGFKLLIWDAYRPVYAQKELWKACPNSQFLVNPNRSFSPHSRGNTVDISMLTLNDEPVEMPTPFDTFSKKADRNYSDCSKMHEKMP